VSSVSDHSDDEYNQVNEVKSPKCGFFNSTYTVSQKKRLNFKTV